MPGSLDSCINSVYEDGAIPASAGLTPVRVLLRDTIDVEVIKSAAAAAEQDWVTLGGIARGALLPSPAFVNSDGTPRQAYVDGVMVNL